MIKRAFLLLVIISGMASGQGLELLSSVEMPGFYFWGIDLQGNYAYLSCECHPDTGMLKIFDISDPYYPILVGEADTLGRGRGQDIIANKDFAYIAEQSGGLQIYNISSPSNPYPIAIAPVEYAAHTLALKNNLIFIANCNRGMTVVDVSNPYQPVIINRYYDRDVGDLEAIYIIDNFAYVASLRGVIAVLDISDPLNPWIVGQNDEYGWGRYYDIIVEDHYAYTSAPGHDVIIFDISDPEHISTVSIIDLNHSVYRLFKYGYYLFVANGTNLDVYNIADVTSPELLCRIEESCFIDVMVRDGIVYTCGYPWFNIYSFAVTDLPEKDNSRSLQIRALANYPNPFNNSTTISYHLTDESFVKLVVYDLLGRETLQLVKENQMPGEHSVHFDADELSSGIYFYRLQAGNIVEYRKMQLLK